MSNLTEIRWHGRGGQGAKTAALLADVEAAYDALRFNGVYRAVYDFVNDLSSVYMDVTKDRLYSEAPASSRRRAVQTVLMNVLEVLVRVMAPILSFTCDEVWECYPPASRGVAGRPDSVQLAGWPRAADFAPSFSADDAEQALRAFAPAIEAREAVTKALEEARAAKAINKSQEASIALTAPADALPALEAVGCEALADLFIVADVAVSEGDGYAAAVFPAAGAKCERCWNYRELGVADGHPDVCARCAEVLDGAAR